MNEMKSFREQIDIIDDQIIKLLDRRFKICHQVALHKKSNKIAVMQNERVEEVKNRCAKLASAYSIDPTFVVNLYSLIIEEACHLENNLINGNFQDEINALSVLTQCSKKIDHVAIAVKNLESAIAFYRDTVGFELVERRDVEGKWSGMTSAVMRAGSITFVLVQGTNPESNVSQYIKNYGAGIQHIAIEVENIEDVMQDLKKRGFELITGIINSSGLNQMFSTRDPNSGIMMEFIERAEDTDGFAENNVQDLFEAMESQGVY